MDPVSAAIIAALVAGLAGGVKQTASQAVSDGYNSLKALLRKKFATHRVVSAVDDLEAQPESHGRQEVLQEEMQSSGAATDPEVLAAAQSLLDQIKTVPGGDQHVQNAVGSYIAQADRGGRANVRVGTGSRPQSGQ